ncbi:MAG: PE family protein [Mycobacterium sp.]|nr:MAG: PE family protein [Mycobacterium sp.]
MVTPESIAQAATALTAIDTTIHAARLQAAAPTQTLLPAAADEVSAGITHVFAQHAEDFQKVAAQASEYHDQFVHTMTAAAGSYAGAEAVNAQRLSQTLDTIANGLIGGGILAFTNLMAWSATLPQPLAQIVFAALLLPLDFLFVIFAIAFLVVLASRGISIFPPYTL